jgi:7-cyano-7-deazaguanine synthase
VVSQPLDALVLLSGGLDSATTLAVALAKGLRTLCLTFDYGQRHREELEAAGRLASVMSASEHQIVRLDMRPIGGSALTDDVDVPKSRGEPDAIPVTYVPARNLIFLSVAAGFAEARGICDIYVGVNAVDYSGYPDCRPQFIESFERTANLGTKAGVEAIARGRVALRVHAPLINLTKAQIIRQGLELGVDYSLTHSCYDPDPEGRACGRCDSCVLRAAGFKSAGVIDPTQYRA